MDFPNSAVDVLYVGPKEVPSPDAQALEELDPDLRRKLDKICSRASNFGQDNLPDSKWFQEHRIIFQFKRRIWSGSEIKSRYQLVHEEPVIFLSDVQNRCEACINTRALNRVQPSVIYSHISLKMFEQKFAQNVTKSAHSFFSSYFMLVGV